MWALDSIGRQLSHMTRLLDDLLDISRITMGKIQLQVDRVDLARVISNAAEATRPLVDSFKHTLAVRLPDSPVVVRADAVRLTQVVANLLNNAAKYTDPGGRIELSAEVASGGRTPPGEVILHVRDNGIGIPP